MILLSMGDMFVCFGKISSASKKFGRKNLESFAKRFSLFYSLNGFYNETKYLIYFKLLCFLLQTINTSNNIKSNPLFTHFDYFIKPHHYRAIIMHDVYHI